MLQGLELTNVRKVRHSLI